MNVFNIERAFRMREERGWDTLWWMIDIHDTIFKGKYASDQEFEMYPGCVEVLQWISDQPNQEIILWTSSYRDHAQKVIDFFRDEYGIYINFFNENPECGSTEIADFSVKPYFNILLDDKAGGNFEYDWLLIAKEIEILTGENIINWTNDNVKNLRLAVEKTILGLEQLLPIQ